MNHTTDLLKILGDIRDAPPDYDGICFAVHSLSRTRTAEGEYEMLLEDAFRTWPGYSGCLAYVIPDPTGMHTPIGVYEETSDEDMWNPDHPYGAKRLELLDWLIDYFTPEERP